MGTPAMTVDCRSTISEGDHGRTGRDSRRGPRRLRPLRLRFHRLARVLQQQDLAAVVRDHRRIATFVVTVLELCWSLQMYIPGASRVPWSERPSQNTVRIPAGWAPSTKVRMMQPRIS